jgi:exodeoxyribonuclease V alpha subunit
VFLAGLHRAERVIAEKLLCLVSGSLPWPPIDPDKALPWIEQRTGLKLAESQKAAVRLALASKVLVITGGPGVGKTTIVNAILRILAAKNVRLLLCAPTGRAAKRMTEATGFEAKTIHRLLEVDPRGGGFKRDGDNPLDCDLLVVDEGSMVDVMLMQALMKAVPENALSSSWATLISFRPSGRGRYWPTSSPPVPWPWSG